MGGLSWGRKEEERKGKESHHLVTKVLRVYNQHFGEPARARTHTHFFWQQVTLGIQWTFWEDLFWDKARDTRFFFGLFFLLFQGGETTAGQAEVGNSAAAAAEREGIPNWMDGRMDDGRMGSMAGRVWCISFSFVQFFAYDFCRKQEREREREKDTLWQQTVASCSVVGFMLTTPLPHPQHTHTHYLLEFERERPYLLLPTCLTSTLHQFSSRAFCLLSF